MQTIGLLFPHQLFENQPILQHTKNVWLIEDSLFFGDKHHPLRFHKLKLTFHRASMRAYQAFLESRGITVTYISYNPNKTLSDLVPIDEKYKFVAIDPTDFLLEKRLRASCKNLVLLPSPLFLNSREENASFLHGRTSFLMHHFYQWQRKRLDILMTSDGEPEGGAWSHDGDNRKKLPKKSYGQVPDDPKPLSNEYVQEAQRYIEKVFPDNPGNLDNFIFPIDHASAQQWFEDFLAKRFSLFGPYEDAITQEHLVLYHSLLSPLLNCGLLSVQDVVEQALAYAKKHSVPINSVEGFIRQIIGWREYMRMMYESHGVTMRNANAWGHNTALPESFYTGTTGIDPIDHVISKVQDYAYAHHIERLMILGNSMFLLEVSPDDVYRWFMEMFIDAYDWVMVPNVYAMSQNSNQGLITTKPYISGSNYIRKMSDYKPGPWADTWDALYWSWVIKNKDLLQAQGRMHFIISRAEKFSDEEQKNTTKQPKHFVAHLKESKDCPACGRVFYNRKRWSLRNQWESVTYCSKRCKMKKRTP